MKAAGKAGGAGMKSFSTAVGKIFPAGLRTDKEVLVHFQSPRSARYVHGTVFYAELVEESLHGVEVSEVLRMDHRGDRDIEPLIAASSYCIDRGRKGPLPP